MDQFLQMKVFFLISAVGLVVLFVFVAVFLFYLNRATRALSKIMDKEEKDINEIGDTTKEIIEDMRDSVIFNFLFKRKKRRTKN